jgi:hypothetical protein
LSTFAALLTARPIGSAVGRPRGDAGAGTPSLGMVSEFADWLTSGSVADTSMSIDKRTNAVISIYLSSKERS